ncbi:MAG TPA: nucleotidyltransferase family protein [Bacteroidales bacterium]|nr:nucleotidyltransferase family protein [Bacteroidales bacterium]
MQPDQPYLKELNNISVELDLLIHTSLNSKSKALFFADKQKEINWKRFLELSGFHRLLPSQDKLQHAGVSIPPEVYSVLQNRMLSGKKKALAFSAETVRIIRLFEKQHIEVMPLKGPVLANIFYGDPGMRQSIDIDFLVHEHNVQEGHALLTEAGYRRILPDSSTDSSLTGIYKIFKKDYSYYHPEKNIPIELHWRLTSHSRLLEDDGLLWDNHVQTIFGNTSVIIPETARTIVYLCLHGSLHQWFRLFWLADLWAVVQNDNINWEKVMDVAGKYGLEHMVAAGFQLASLIFQVPFPQPLKKYCTHPKVMRIVSQSLKTIIASEIPLKKSRRLKRIFYFASFRNDLKYKIKCFTDVAGRWLVMKLIRAKEPETHTPGQ